MGCISGEARAAVVAEALAGANRHAALIAEEGFVVLGGGRGRRGLSGRRGGRRLRGLVLLGWPRLTGLTIRLSALSGWRRGRRWLLSLLSLRVLEAIL